MSIEDKTTQTPQTQHPNSAPKQEFAAVADTIESPLAVDEELAALHAQVEELCQQVQEVHALREQQVQLSDQYLRAKAEVDNVRRRCDEDVAKARKFSIESFAKELLAVADSLDAALALEEASAEQLSEGTKATQNQLLTVFAHNKIERIAPQQGEKFDPNIHQAISSAPVQQEPNTVVSVLQNGYSLDGRILRAAFVVVAAAQA